MNDTQNGGSNTVSINSTSPLPIYTFTVYSQGTKSFTKGHKIKCYTTIYISLVNGDVLNGGRVNNTTYVTIAR